jgi:hypothetical protein
MATWDRELLELILVPKLLYSTWLEGLRYGYGLSYGRNQETKFDSSLVRIMELVLELVGEARVRGFPRLREGFVAV